MIVCVCNNITQVTVQEAAEKAESFPRMLEMLKYKKDCGICVDELKKIWNEVNKESP